MRSMLLPGPVMESLNIDDGVVKVYFAGWNRKKI